MSTRQVKLVGTTPFGWDLVDAKTGESLGLVISAADVVLVPGELLKARVTFEIVEVAIKDRALGAKA